MEDLELQYENIDWGDIVEAELSGDQETLRELRERAAEMKRREKEERQAKSESCLEETESPLSRRPSRPSQQQQRRRAPRKHQEDDLSAQLLALAENPVGETTQDKENLSFANFHPSGQVTRENTASYAHIVTRNCKRTLVDRCLSPSEVPVKRQVTSEMMKTPTEFKTFLPYTSPSCDTTPETGSLAGKAGMVQRRLFDGTQIQQQQTSGPAQSTTIRGELTDCHRLAQRQKQIDFGKNTLGYERYIQLVPKWKRQKTDPVTPDKTSPCSTRKWQGRMRIWRKELHKFDPAPHNQEHQFSLADAALCNVTLDQNDP